VILILLVVLVSFCFSVRHSTIPSPTSYAIYDIQPNTTVAEEFKCWQSTPGIVNGPCTDRVETVFTAQVVTKGFLLLFLFCLILSWHVYHSNPFSKKVAILILLTSAGDATLSVSFYLLQIRDVFACHRVGNWARLESLSYQLITFLVIVFVIGREFVYLKN